MTTSANRKSSQKEAAKKRKQTWKPGQSGNPKGAPKRGDSWAETIKAIGEMDGPGIAALWDTRHKEFGKLPEGITMKQLVVMTVYAALLREPSPGNWRELMDRAEGKVLQPHSIEWREQLRQHGIDESTAAEQFEQMVASAAQRLGVDGGGSDDRGSEAA